MTTKYPAGAILRVTIDVLLPVSATEKEISDWIRFSMCRSGSIENSNPLADEEPEEFGYRSCDWEWDGCVGRVEQFDRQQMPDGSTHYKVRFVRERVT